MTRITFFRCGTVTFQKVWSVPAPSILAARSRPLGTVCKPASKRTIANGNSFQTFTTITAGIARSRESRKTIERSIQPELLERAADQPVITVVEPAPDIGSGHLADDVGDQEQTTDDAAPGEFAIHYQSRPEAEDEGEEGRGDGPDESVLGRFPEAELRVAEDPLVVSIPLKYQLAELGGVLKNDR